MQALDGNAIAGQLFERFGAELTAAEGRCASCGARAAIAQLRVYNRAPGTVVRCPSCGSVTIVLTRRGGHTSVNLDGFRLFEPPGGRPEETKSR
jgi:predicted RNA-binding Zn-ribbon protein involved in translation (DUF1610 family)